MSANRGRHPHHDAPDTGDELRRLAGLPDGPERDGLREEVVRAWLPMAHRIAGRYRDRGEALDDLRQVAAVGLVKAVDHFDPGRGAAFESYAVPTITGEVRRHFRDHTWCLRVPRRTQELRGRVRAVYQELSQSGREPSVTEIAERAALEVAEVREGLSALHAHTALSLDAELAPGADGGSATLADTLGAPDPALETVVEREAVKRLIGDLTERERRILYLRFFRGMTQSRIAEEFGISQMHVSRLLSSTCARLRSRVTAGAA
ncbi:SigB/SigF/SigG family RNA polymerase sigma factor [Streptomyces yaizuensis]|uniref:SigB/SigF/SigG family RNA polymerase sigma factor n=1 Tax=Streptomyces yaizuensis TaxID=2989713 RepID=A0ABQ5NSE4_9ACTN|nr:SigB/SigF/SigG family RNA polymerase sigma factor [Streptomyces sp. YSPA8]GLF93065.1 SigB/SigF/SigG family RNA polymerase sigma factor [Streptomyces sp. YSPA8]